MNTATRRYTAAGAALTVAAAVAVTPIQPRPSAIPVVYEATRLAAAQSVLNIPFNLFQDLVNIPNAEIEAMSLLGNSLISSGTWFTASATNIWGEDPGDPGHFMGLIAMAVPIKEISGLGNPLPGYGAFSWGDAAAGHLGLGQQIVLLLNAEIPVSASSAADWSAPLFPVSPITGSTSIDRTIWSVALLLGIQKYPLLQNWFQVPISDMTDADGYTFGDVINPSHGVGTDGAVPTDDVFGIPGTVSGVDAAGNPVNLMPWSNQTFKLDLLWPLVNWWNSLQAAPDLDGFELPSVEEFGRALQTLGAGAVISFYPLVPGSPLCPGTCNVDAPFQLKSVVQDISNLWPGNTSVQHWLDLVNQAGPGPFGMANGPTWHQVDFVKAWQDDSQQGWFDLGNPSPADPPSNIDTPMSFPVSKPMQSLIDFAKASGIQDFFQAWADIAGYTPINPADLPGPDDNSGPGALAATAPGKDNALSTLAVSTLEKGKAALSKLSAEAPATTTKESRTPVGNDLEVSVDEVAPAENEHDGTGTRISARDLMKNGNTIAPGETLTNPRPLHRAQDTSRATSSWGKLGGALKKGLTGKPGNAGKHRKTGNRTMKDAADTGRGSSSKDAA